MCEDYFNHNETDCSTKNANPNPVYVPAISPPPIPTFHIIFGRARSHGNIAIAFILKIFRVFSSPFIRLYKAYRDPLPREKSNYAATTYEMAEMSMRFGILGVVIGWACLLFTFFPIAAFVLGEISYHRIKRNPTQLSGKRMALTGSFLGCIGIILVVASALVHGVIPKQD